MDITPYVDSLRRDLVAAAEAAGPETRQAAERLAFALDPAARLALMEAISQAAAEITAEMPTGGVDVRLDGRDLDFVVAGRPARGARPRRRPPPPPGARGRRGRRRRPDHPADPGVGQGPGRGARRPPPATPSTPGWSTWSAPPPASSAVNVDIDLSSLPFFGGNDPFGAKGRAATAA